MLKRHDFSVDAVHHDIDDEVPSQLFMIDDSNFNVGYDGVASCDFEYFHVSQLKTICNIFTYLVDVFGHGFLSEGSL